MIFFEVMPHPHVLCFFLEVIEKKMTAKKCSDNSSANIVSNLLLVLMAVESYLPHKSQPPVSFFVPPRHNDLMKWFLETFYILRAKIT